MTILITGGGTGGHLAIAKSLRDAALNAGHRAVFVGSMSGQDRAWFEEDTLFERVHFLQTSGVVNKKGLARISSLLSSIRATLSALLLVTKADCVVSVGGFSAAPASFAAVLLRKPFYIHEQNAALGRLNRLLRPFSKAFFSSYELNSVLKDYPVRASFFEGSRNREKVKTVIFLGGSQGARFINDLALKIAPLLHEKGIKIIHQAGKQELEKVKNAYQELGVEAELFAFRADIDTLMQASDLAVSRSGASTLWELCASGLPALYIPYPYAAADHQFFNAKFLAEKNASWLCRQEEDPYLLLLRLLDMNMKEHSECLQKLIRPNGAELIIKEVEKCLQK